VSAAGNGLGRLHLVLRGGRRPSLPIGEALHPIALAAAIVLVVNDWLLKPSAAPAWLTGKLSDVAGLVVAPVALTAAIGLVLWAAARLGARVDPWLTRRRLATAIAATAAVFAAVKLSPAVAARAGAVWGHVAPAARFVADPTDLLALPALAIAWWIGRQELAWIQAARDDDAAARAAAGARSHT
jgi:hypothetical protein